MAIKTDRTYLTRRWLLQAGLTAAAAAAAGCATGTPDRSRRALPVTTGEPPAAPSHPPVDPASVKANEVGLIPVIMYHRIVPTVAGEYDRTPADFRAELQRMFGEGYRPVRTIDLVRGRLDVPAGTTPVVLTFDDGYHEHLRYTPDGSIDPTCAVGILLAVTREFEGCRPAGSFNINKNPFALTTPDQQRRAFDDLNRLGFEVANHTYDHTSLRQLTAAQVQREFVLLQQLVQTAVPAAQVCTMALPLGISPRDSQLAHTGSYQGHTYLNEGVLLVGATPAPSPYSSTFQPLAIPRIRSTSWQGGRLRYGSTYWLDYLTAHPAQRYISAGNPDRITVPTALAGRVAARYHNQLTLY